MNCVGVYQKEVRRRPNNKSRNSSSFAACGGLGCYGNGWQDLDDDTLMQSKLTMDDDETFPTMDDTSYTNMDDDLYTFDEEDEGTYDTYQSNSTSGKRIRSSLLAKNTAMEGRSPSQDEANKLPPYNKQRSSDDSMSMWSGIVSHRPDNTTKTANSNKPSSSNNKRFSRGDSADDLEKRLKMWSDILVAAVEEKGLAGAAAEATSAAFSNEEPSSSDGDDLKHLVHMMRNSVKEGVQEASKAALEAEVVRTFQTNLDSFVKNYKAKREQTEENKNDDDNGDGDDDYENTTTSHLSWITPQTNGTTRDQQPLNSLAMRMRSMATKEPTRTYAVSESDQVPDAIKKVSPASVSTATTTTSENNNNINENKTSPKSKLHKVASSNSIASTLTPVEGLLRLPTAVSVSKNSSSMSFSGISMADTSSHRGDAASVYSASTEQIPSSIRLSRPSSFFERIGSGNTKAADDNTVAATTTNTPTRPPRKQLLPPMPPPSRSTVPSFGRSSKLQEPRCDSSTSVASSGTELARVSTPPKIQRSTTSTSSTGIGLRKRFSFRRKPSTKAAKDTSPKSTIDFSTTAEYYVDGSFIDIDDDASNIGAVPLEDSILSSSDSVHGVLSNETNRLLSQSVEMTRLEI